MDIVSSLRNHLLVAVPSVHDTKFEHAVIYICDHQAEGTVGLIVNQPIDLLHNLSKAQNYKYLQSN